MTTLPCNLIRAAFLLCCFAAAAAAEDGRGAIEQERERVRLELATARATYPAFDEHLDQVVIHITRHPSLSFEQAYCVVIRGVREEPACRSVLADLAISLALPLVPPAGALVLAESRDGSYQVLTGGDMLPVFEREKATTPFAPPRLRDAYGPGVHQDATGRPFGFFTQEGERALGPVKLHGYGLGVHMDQYGRPVHAIPQH